MKFPAFIIAAVLACGSTAFAAGTQDSSASGSSAKGTAHQLATDFRQALHKLGAATRHVLHRGESAVHSNGDHNS